MGTLTAPSFERGIEVYRVEQSGSALATSQRWGQECIRGVRALTIQRMEKMVPTFQAIQVGSELNLDSKVYINDSR
jgi:hypothetical protein